MPFFYFLLKIRGWWGHITSSRAFPHGNFFLRQSISFWTDKSASFAYLLTHVTAARVSLQFFPIYFTLSVCDTLFRWLTGGIPKLTWWNPFIDKTGYLTSAEKHGHPEIPYKIFPLGNMSYYSSQGTCFINYTVVITIPCYLKKQRYQNCPMEALSPIPLDQP